MRITTFVCEITAKIILEDDEPEEVYERFEKDYAEECPCIETFEEWCIEEFCDKYCLEELPQDAVVNSLEDSEEYEPDPYLRYGLSEKDF